MAQNGSSTGWVTHNFLTRCILKNAELLISKRDGQNETTKKPRLLPRPPTDHAAIALESMTGVAFIQARMRAHCAEDDMWKAHLSPDGPPIDEIPVEPQFQGEILVFGLEIEEDIGAHVEEVEDLPEDLLYIEEQLSVQGDFVDESEESLNPDEVRELIAESRRQEQSALNYARREIYIVNARNRMVNPYLLDESGQRLRPDNDDTYTESLLNLSTNVSTTRSFELRAGLDHSFEISTDHGPSQSSKDEASFCELEFSDNDSFMDYAVADDNESSVPTEASLAAMEIEDSQFNEFVSWCELDL